MINKAQGLGLSLITKLAGSDVLDQLKLVNFLKGLFTKVQKLVLEH